jgi:hypothetical protein
MATIRLDFAYEGDNVEDALAEYLASYEGEVTARVTDEEGPGGWPVVAFETDDQTVMHDLLVNYTNGDIDDALYLALALLVPDLN